MRQVTTVFLLTLLAGCGSGSITADELEAFFNEKRIDNNRAVALKKSSSAGGAAYLLTLHGYPNNLSVCEELIKPYNADPKQSVIQGTYYCQQLGK